MVFFLGGGGFFVEKCLVGVGIVLEPRTAIDFLQMLKGARFFMSYCQTIFNKCHTKKAFFMKNKMSSKI